MTKVKPKKLLKKHRKIAIRTLTALPIAVGGALAITAIFMPGGDLITPEGDPTISVTGDEASFTFNFAEKPDDGLANVEISRQEQTEIVIVDTKNSSIVVNDGKGVVTFKQKQSIAQKGTTSFDLSFTYTFNSQQKTVSVKGLKIIWDIPSHTISIECVGNPGVIMWNAYDSGSYKFPINKGFKVYLDGKSEQDVTQYATFETDFGDAVWVDKENNELCWSDTIAPCKRVCHISASISEYGLKTTTPVEITFDFYGASISGGSTTELTDFKTTSEGIDMLPYYLEVNDTSTTATPEDAMYQIIPHEGTTLPTYITLNDKGCLNWTPQTGVIPTPGDFYFYVKGNGTYQGLSFEATSNKIHLHIPTIKLENPTKDVNVVKGVDGETNIGLAFFLDGLKQNDITCTVTNQTELKGKYSIAADGTLTWKGVTADKETVQIRVSYGNIYWADTSVNVVNHTAVLTGGNRQLEYGNQKDTDKWGLEIDRVVQPSQLSLVKAESTDPLDNKNIWISEDGIVNWTKDALTQKGSISFRVKATVTGSWFAGSYYSFIITLTRQDNPNLTGPTEATIIVGNPDQTDDPFVLSTVEGVTETPTLTLADEISGIALNEDGYLTWDGTQTTAQSPLEATVVGTVGLYKVEKKITLTIVDVPFIDAPEGTSFEGLGTEGQEFGKFNFIVEGKVCRDADLQFTIDDYYKTWWEMVKKGDGENSYWVIRAKSYISGCENPMTITANDQKGHSESLNVSINTFILRVDNPVIYADNKKEVTYQCSAEIQDTGVTTPIDPTKATWSISPQIEGVEIGEHTGIINIPAGKQIHIHGATDNIHIVATYTYKETVITSYTNCDIHVDSANVSGGTNPITLDEDGNFIDNAAWSLKIGSIEVPDAKMELVDVSTSLEDKISINKGKVTITSGKTGSFRVKGSHNTYGVDVVSGIINVTEPVVNYEITNIPDVLYATQGYSGGLIDHPYVTKNGTKLDLGVGVEWSKIEGPDGVNIRAEGGAVYTNMCHMTCSTNNLEPGNYDVKLQAVVEGVSTPIQKTVVLSVVGPQGIVKVNEDDTTWQLATDHQIGFEFSPGTDKNIKFKDIQIDGLLKGLGFSVDIDIEEGATEGIINVHHNGGSIGGVDQTGYITATFNYLGSYITYIINIKILH